ncbi:MAG: protein kinase [Fuerstiella sp.]
MTNKNSNSDSSSDRSDEFPEDPDMGFASDSHVPFGPSGRDAFGQSEHAADSQDASETQWVPEPTLEDEATQNDPQVRPREEGIDDTWVPPDQADLPAQNSEANSTSFDPNATWVPSSTPTTDGIVSDDEADECDPNRTWVPSSTPTADGIVSDDEADDCDPNRTWVPSSTPTADGIVSDDEADDCDPNRTWVPSSTPTADGIVSDDEADECDPNRTWVPSSTSEEDSVAADAELFEKTWVIPSGPDSDGSSDDHFSEVPSREDETEVSDPNKTWAPTSSVTTDGIADEAAANSDDQGTEKQSTGKRNNGDENDQGDENCGVDQTWVMPERPALPDGVFDQSDSQDDGSGTWVPSTAPTRAGTPQPKMPVDLTETIDIQAGASPSVPEPTVEDTVELEQGQRSQPAGGSPANDDQSTADGGDVFQKTIGMRRPLDSSDLPPAAMMDSEAGKTIHLDLPDNATRQLNANATQLWARQSGADLNQSLTIRSRPVSGNAQFETANGPSDQPDYQIVEKIGEGGMGAIFLATQTSLDRQLAIKTLKAPRSGARYSGSSGRHSSSADRQRRDMFLAEALITANLVHPHIIPIHDLCETAEGLPFYSMKRVVGIPWCERIREMELDENLEVLMKVCDAIAYAHHNGVVNRDLKPENVMLGEFGEVLVLDWGLAVPSSAADKKKFNSPSAPFGAGTPAYMAPELWTGPEEIIGYWSDIYLLGAILFEIITGKAPHKFAEPSAKAGSTGLWMVIDKVVRQNSIRPTEHDGELMQIALTAMETRPKNRFASVLKFQEALKQFQHHEESRRLAGRAADTLQTAKTSQADSGYLGYQSAAALFEEAQAAWAENPDATEGLKDTRLHYAGLAHQKGDYDLGLQIASLEEGPAFIEVRRKLLRSRRLRNTLKSAIIAAAAIIVAVGIFSFIQSREIAEQNNQIIALNGTRESLQADISSAKDEIIDAEVKRKQADRKAIAAEQRALAAADEADAAILKVATADKKLIESNAKLDVADGRLKAASNKLAEADIKLLAANNTLQETEQKVGELQIKKSRSAVDLKNTEIASLIRNGDYSNALTEVDRLLIDLESSTEMNSLPENEQQQRRIELQARRRQLMQRAVRVDVPVQSQVISQSGKQIVWADQNAKLQVRRYSRQEGISQQVVAEVQLDQTASSLVAAETEHVVLAADGFNVKVWDIAAGDMSTLSGHQAKVTTIRVSGEFVISADAGGSIRAWSLKTSQQLWSIRSSSRIIDLVLLPEEKMFIYAGSRGGESADILAYQLAGLADSVERPTRLGQLKFPRNQNDPPRSLAVSPDGQRLLISNSRNGRVLVLPRRDAGQMSGRDLFPFMHVTDLAAGQQSELWVADRHQRPVNQISWSADGSRFCTASDDRTIGVWELTLEGGPLLLQRLEGHGARVNSAAFTDFAGTEIVSISADRYCRFWDVENYQSDKKKLEAEFKLSKLERQSGPVLGRNWAGVSSTRMAALHTARPTLLADFLAKVASVGGAATLMQPTVANTLFSLPAAMLGEDLFSSANSSKDDADQIIRFNHAPRIHQGTITAVEVSADGKLLTTGGSDGTAVIWDTQSGLPLTSVAASASTASAFDEGHDFNVSRFHFLPPDGKHLLTTGFDGNLCVWNADTEKAGAGHQTLRMPGLGLVNAISASADGQSIIMSALAEDQSPGVCRVYRMADLLNADDPRPVSELVGFHTGEISAISIDTAGEFAATGGRDGRVALWSCADGRLIAAGRIHAKNTIVSNLKLFDDGRILSSGYDGRLLLLQASEVGKPNTAAMTFDVLQRFVHDRIPIERVAVHPDGNQFVTISIRTNRMTQKIDYELHLWDISQQDSVQRLNPAMIEGRPPVRISSVDFSAQGNRLAVVIDQRIQVLDSASWKVIRVVGATGTGISDAIFSPSIVDGKSSETIATFDGVAAHLWNLKTGSQLAEFRPLFSVASLARSKHELPLLLTGDRSIRLFQSSADDKRFGRCVFKIEDPHSGIVNALQFHPMKHDVFASGGTDGAICFWRWQEGKKNAELTRRVLVGDAKTNIVDLCWAADGKFVWVVEQNGGLKKLAEDGSIVLECDMLAEQNFEAADLCLRPDGKFLAVCGKMQNGGVSTAWIFQQLTDQEIRTAELVVHCRLDGHEAGGMEGIGFLKTSPYVVTAGADGACLVWNWMPERSAERPIEAYEAFQFLSRKSRVAHQAPINSISVTDQGDVATVSDDGTGVLWRNPFRETAVEAKDGEE